MTVVIVVVGLASDASFASGAEDRPLVYTEVAGQLKVGIGGLATGLAPGVTAGAGVQLVRWSAGIVGSYSKFKPDRGRYADFRVVCIGTCGSISATGSFTSVGLRLRLHPMGWGRFKPFVEGEAGYNAISIVALASKEDTLHGLHLVGAGGIDVILSRYLIAHASVGYSFSLVEQSPPLTIAANHAHHLQSEIGLRFVF